MGLSCIVSNLRERWPPGLASLDTTENLLFADAFPRLDHTGSTFDQVLGHTELEVTEAAVHTCIVSRRRRRRKAQRTPLASRLLPLAYASRLL